MKTCNRCKSEKPLFDFSKKCDTADGLTSRCKACLSEVRKTDYATRGDVIRARNKRWYEANSDFVNEQKKTRLDRKLHSARCKAYREKNKDAVKAMNEAWAARNAEKIREYWRNYAARNVDARNARSSQRRAKKLMATPSWDSELTDLTSREACSLARLRTKLFGFKWNVDHIVPLAGKIVTGFHVWNNLQVIPANDNRRKSNSFEVSA